MATSKALQKATVIAKTVAKFTGNIGDMIDQLHTLREHKRALEAQVAAVEGEYKGVEEELMERLGREGVDASRGKLASCSISVSVSGNVLDWDALNAWIAKTKNFQLYQRRISDPAFRELMEMKKGTPPPGMEPFSKKRLNVRSL
jgi:hypothetical protein